MALPSLAEVADLEVRLRVEVGSLSGADLDYAEACLEDASSQVRAASGRDWVDDEGNLDVPASLVTVTLQAALRGYRNPDGVASENFGVYSYNLPQGETSVMLTKREERVCERVAETFAKEEPGAGNFVGSMKTRSAYSEPDDDSTEEGITFTL